MRQGVRQPEMPNRRVGNWLAHQNIVCEPWWANELPALRLNAGAMVRQPETLAPRPYGLLASRALAKNTQAA